jgi:uncharacterized protein (DUF302 family)
VHEIDFEIAVDSSLSFEEAVAAVERATAEAGFRVLYVHDVQATLAEKGFERPPMKIVEVCSARYAHAVLAADPRVALMLPCRVAVWTQDGATKVSTVKPSVIAAFYPQAGIEATAAEVEGILRGIVEVAR